jgi:hypothetical protein
MRSAGIARPTVLILSMIFDGSRVCEVIKVALLMIHIQFRSMYGSAKTPPPSSS